MSRARWVSSVVGAAVVLAASTARAQPQQFFALLSGPAEAPPNASPGTGITFVTIDPTAHTLRVFADFQNLLGTTTASHIHCCVAPPGAAPVATATPTFPGFPLGVTAGTYDQTFNTLLASTYRAGFITSSGGTPAAAENVLFTGIRAGRAYLNIHTNQFPGGEIRGFLTATPEPSTYALMATGLLALGGIARRRRG